MKPIFNLSLVLSFVLCPALFSQTVGGSWELGPPLAGARSLDEFGWVLAVGPDIDGDGVPEMAVGLRGHRDSLFREVGAVSLMSGRTGQILWTYEAPYVLLGSGEGPELSFTSDLDGDGVADLVCGSERAQSGMGKVTILSGINGAFIREHVGTPGPIWGTGPKLGHKVVGISDVDGDGYGDYVYSEVDSTVPGGLVFAGRIVCRSGFTGNLLWEFYGANEYDMLGRNLSLGPDFTGDHVPEILASSINVAVGGFANMGLIYLLDGVTGTFIRTYAPPNFTPGNGFGWSLTSVSDLDGDSMNDIAVGSSATSTQHGGFSGYVEVISSLTGARLWGTEGIAHGGQMGTRLFNIGDLNQDGYDDLATNTNWILGVGVDVPILSGQDGSFLWTLEYSLASSQNAGFGGAGIGSFDRTGDGIPEIFVGEAGADSGGQSSGMVDVFSFKPFLYRLSGAVSASTPSSLKLGLDFPSTEAGQAFAILASASGNAATTFQGLDVPLVVDATFWLSLQNPPASFRGILDGEGDGVVHITVPPLAALPFVGSTLYLAAVTFSGSQARLSSVAVPIEVTP